MKAAFINATGPAANIQFGELPRPEPRHNQALVRVTAASINPIDTYIRSGLVPMELPKPFVVGCDLAPEMARALVAMPRITRLSPAPTGWA